jgi:hypothetical protein
MTAARIKEMAGQFVLIWEDEEGPKAIGAFDSVSEAYMYATSHDIPVYDPDWA